jgi:hypothetical protein
MLRIHVRNFWPYECSQPSENDSLSHKGLKSAKRTTINTKSKSLNLKVTHYVGKSSKHRDKNHKLSHFEWINRLPLIEQFPKPPNQHDETKANKQRKTHFKKLQNGFEKPQRSQNGSHSFLMRIPVAPPSVVAQQNFRIRRSHHRAPDWYRHLDLVSRITRMWHCRSILSPSEFPTVIQE